LWIDAIYATVRQNDRIVAVAAIVAVGVNSEGRAKCSAWILVRPKPRRMGVQRACNLTLETVAPLSDGPTGRPSGYRQLACPTLAGERGARPPVAPGPGTRSRADESLAVLSPPS
jgi:hypothetical protein